MIINWTIRPTSDTTALTEYGNDKWDVPTTLKDKKKAGDPSRPVKQRSLLINALHGFLPRTDAGNGLKNGFSVCAKLAQIHESLDFSERVIVAGKGSANAGKMRHDSFETGVVADRQDFLLLLLIGVSSSHAQHTVGHNRKIFRHQIVHFPTSAGVSEVSEQASERERSGAHD